MLNRSSGKNNVTVFSLIEAGSQIQAESLIQAGSLTEAGGLKVEYHRTNCAVVHCFIRAYCVISI